MNSAGSSEIDFVSVHCCLEYFFNQGDRLYLKLVHWTVVFWGMLSYLSDE